jgi:hypothetical protein
MSIGAVKFFRFSTDRPSIRVSRFSFAALSRRAGQKSDFLIRHPLQIEIKQQAAAAASRAERRKHNTIFYAGMRKSKTEEEGEKNRIFLQCCKISLLAQIISART